MFYRKEIIPRFLFSLLFNILRGVFAFLVGLKIARDLGPEEYGNFSFLLGSFLAIKHLIDLGTSSAFFTFISQEKQSKHFYLLYLSWQLIQFFVIVVLIGVILPDSWLEYLWQGQNRHRILLAFCVSFLINHAWLTCNSITESLRYSIFIQFWNMLIMIAQCITIYVLNEFYEIKIELLFYMICALHLVAIIICGYLIFPKIEFIKNNNNQINKILFKYIKYCSPLIILSIVSFVYHFADRWLLQNYAGAIQQGMYAIAFKVTMVVMLITASITNIFWKEIAESYKNNNIVKIAELYLKTTKTLFFITVFISCLLLPWADVLIHYLLGTEYANAIVPLTIMLFYPVHQCLGQINGSVFMATELTKLSTIIANIFLLLSVPIVYLLIAPSDAYITGLNLGATGVAVKMVVLQIVAVNVQCFYLSKKLKFKYDWSYQPIILIVYTGVSYGIKYFLIEAMSWISTHNMLYIITVHLIIYILFTLMFIYKFPTMLGQSTTNIKNIYFKIFNKLKMNS